MVTFDGLKEWIQRTGITVEPFVQNDLASGMDIKCRWPTEEEANIELAAITTHFRFDTSHDLGIVSVTEHTYFKITCSQPCSASDALPIHSPSAAINHLCCRSDRTDHGLQIQFGR